MPAGFEGAMAVGRIGEWRTGQEQDISGGSVLPLIKVSLDVVLRL